MAGHDKSQGIGLAGLSHCPRSARAAQGLGQLSVGFRFPIRDFGNPLPHPPLKSGALFHKWRAGLRWKFATASFEKFCEKINKTMAAGVVRQRGKAERSSEPLFCHFMFFRIEAEMNREIVNANDLAAYFFENEGEALNRLGWHRAESLIEKGSAFDKKDRNSLLRLSLPFSWVILGHLLR